MTVCLRTEFEVSVRQNVVVEGIKQTGCKCLLVKVKSGIDHKYAVWLAQI